MIILLILKLNLFHQFSPCMLIEQILDRTHSFDSSFNLQYATLKQLVEYKTLFDFKNLSSPGFLLPLPFLCFRDEVRVIYGLSTVVMFIREVLTLMLLLCYLTAHSIRVIPYNCKAFLSSGSKKPLANYFYEIEKRT